MKGAVGSPACKLIMLHGGPLNGSIISKSVTKLLFFGDVCYLIREEDKDYYHYDYVDSQSVADQLPPSNNNGEEE
ncbi:hypothetical protein LCGC14_1407890 [marine sediment metagenome]|uniref:Uncharacterized protein n=1 Tax=marine sediment metagenome TaxID=412755 RepID=A0A0F9KG30_9ZZZZ